MKRGSQRDEEVRKKDQRSVGVRVEMICSPSKAAMNSMDYVSRCEENARSENRVIRVTIRRQFARRFGWNEPPSLKEPGGRICLSNGTERGRGREWNENGQKIAQGKQKIKRDGSIKKYHYSRHIDLRDYTLCIQFSALRSSLYFEQCEESFSSCKFANSVDIMVKVNDEDMRYGIWRMGGLCN